MVLSRGGIKVKRRRGRTRDVSVCVFVSFRSQPGQVPGKRADGGEAVPIAAILAHEFDQPLARLPVLCAERAQQPLVAGLQLLLLGFHLFSLQEGPEGEGGIIKRLRGVGRGSDDSEHVLLT